MEKYVKPIVVQMRGDATPIAPSYPAIGGAFGFLVGLMSGDSHGIVRKEGKCLDVEEKDRMFR